MPKRERKPSAKAKGAAGSSYHIEESPKRKKRKKKGKKPVFTFNFLWGEELYETLVVLVKTLKKVIKDDNFTPSNMHDAMDRHFGDQFGIGMAFSDFECQWGKQRKRQWATLFSTLMQSFHM